MAAVGAALAVNVAGIWSIAVARRGALDEERLALGRRVEARARAIEARLASVRTDLAFMAAASLGAVATNRGGPEWRRQTRGSLLLFLRGHPEVVRIVVLAASGEPLLHAGRRGGVPVLWVADQPTGDEGAAIAPGTPRPTTRVAWTHAGEGRSEETLLEAEVSAHELLRGAGSWSCVLRDAVGDELAADAGAPDPRRADARIGAGAQIDADAWSAPAPWRLDCLEPDDSGAALGAPIVERFRFTMLLNMVVIALAAFLGAFAVAQARTRARLEATAREEQRTRALERQLLHAERLTTVGRLAAGIAHEINNPLEGMANWLSLAREALGRGDLEGTGGHLDRVKEGLDRAAGTVRQVLAHADPARAPTADVDLNEILRNGADFVRSRGEFDGVEIATELSPEPLTVRGNATMLGQVALNLILNACEAQAEGGEVLVRTRSEAGAVIAELADRGPGVPAEDRQRIIEPFYSTKDSSGLGLSICHTILREHGGELQVDDREGGGALVTVRLPAAAARGAL